MNGLAAIDGLGEIAVTYRGEMHFNTYELRDQNSYHKKTSIDLRSELR